MSITKLDISALWSEPLWQPRDLGTLLPPVPHGISVCLPTWQDTVGYEEGDARVIDALQGGYPRFVVPKASLALFEKMTADYGQPGELCQVYPSLAAARRCCDFISRHSDYTARVHDCGTDTWAVFFNQDAAGEAKSYWCHSGEGILSRQATAILEKRPPAHADESISIIKDRLAAMHRTDSSRVFLFPTGMAAIWTAMRFFRLKRPRAESIQFGFPYVDTLKLQERTGNGHRFFPMGNAQDIDRVEQLTASREISALFCEAPSNPLLISSDIPRLSHSLRTHGTPFVIDDTLSACGNLAILPQCDVVATSLTKYFSGIGDVMGGALVVNPGSPWEAELSDFLESDDHSTLWGDDALQLEVNSRDLQQRIGAVNCNAEVLADYLQRHPAIETVYYPKFTNRQEYDLIRNPNGGFGGLLSFTLKQEKRAPEVLDALKVCKGPNLGMEYTLACPFTLLAHYDELAFVERCGLSPWLIRVAVGMERIDELIARFNNALLSI